jgi:hypothetical protein
MHETNKIVGITQVPKKYFALGRQTACASENGVMPDRQVQLSYEQERKYYGRNHMEQPPDPDFCIDRFDCF